MTTTVDFEQQVRDGQKACRDCHRTLPMADFPPHKGMRDGRLGSCRTCRNAKLAACRLDRLAKAEPCVEGCGRPIEKLGKWCAACHARITRTAIESNNRRRAARNGIKPRRIAAHLILQKVAYWGSRCWLCGVPSTEMDHVKPLSKGGAHLLCNLRPICRHCNATKNDSWPLSLGSGS